MDRYEARRIGKQLLGDRVATVLESVGARRVAQVYERVTGRPCGCAARTLTLNQFDQQWRGRKQ